jgi:hypothetical protein
MSSGGDLSKNDLVMKVLYTMIQGPFRQLKTSLRGSTLTWRWKDIIVAYKKMGKWYNEAVLN